MNFQVMTNIPDPGVAESVNDAYFMKILDLAGDKSPLSLEDFKLETVIFANVILDCSKRKEHQTFVSNNKFASRA